MAASEEDEEWKFSFSPFRMLGLSFDNLTPAVIKKAHKTLIFDHHPDRASPQEKEEKTELSARLNASYKFLKNKNPEQLKELAKKFIGAAASDVATGAWSVDGVDLSHVLVDKTQSEHFRRVFKKNEKLAGETFFCDNSQIFYVSLFEKVSVQPEMKGYYYYCGFCEEEFLQEDHHYELVFEPYLEYIMKEADTEDYFEKMKEVKEFWKKVPDLASFRANEGISRFEEELKFWNDKLAYLFSIPPTNPFLELLGADTQQEKWIKEIRSIKTRIYDDEIEFLEKLFFMRSLSAEELLESLSRTYRNIMKYFERDYISLKVIFILFLQNIKEFNNWRKLALQATSVFPALALPLADFGHHENPHPQGENYYYELGMGLVKAKERPAPYEQAHACFVSGSCDLHQVAMKIMDTTKDRGWLHLAAFYLAKTRKWEDFLKLTTHIAKEDNNETSSFALYYMYLEAENIDSECVIKSLQSVLPDQQFWKFVQFLAVYQLQLVLGSATITEFVATKICAGMNEADDEYILHLLGQLLGNDALPSTSLALHANVLKTVGSGLHLFGESMKPELQTKYRNLITKTFATLRMQLKSNLIFGNAEFCVALARIPEVTSFLKTVLEEQKFLGPNADKPVPMNDRFTCLLLLRAIYHYKRGHYNEMTEDFASAAINTLKRSTVGQAIAKFFSSNPMIHEKVVKVGCSQFNRLVECLTSEDSQDSMLDECNFVQIMTKTSANLEIFLSENITVSSVGDKGPDLNCLEQNILSGSEKTPEELAEKGYSYVDLMAISGSGPLILCCLSAAAHFFTQAMLKTKKNNLAQIFGYRSLVLECSNQMTGFKETRVFPEALALHALRASMGYRVMSNKYFQQILKQNRGKKGGTGFIDSSELKFEAGLWQMLLNLRMLCPVSLSHVYGIAEGRLALGSMLSLNHFLVSGKNAVGMFSDNAPEYLYRHAAFKAVWNEDIKPEDTDFEDLIPEPSEFNDYKEKIDEEKDSEEEKQRKRERNQELETEKLEAESILKELKNTPLVYREGFEATRGNCMQALADIWGFQIVDVERMMNWNCLRRTTDGFLDMSSRDLNFDDDVQTFSAFGGVRFDHKINKFYLLLERSRPGDPNRPALFSSVDLIEIFGTKVVFAELSFDDNLFPPDNVPVHNQSQLPFHPFFNVRYGAAAAGSEKATRELICGTNLLMTLYHLDLLLKMLTTGQEVSADFPFRFQSTKTMLQGLSKELQQILKPIGERKPVGKLKEMETCHRFWFSVDDVEREIVQASKSNGESSKILMGEATLVVKTMRMERNAQGELSDAEHLFDEHSAEGKFVKEFNENIKLIEKEFPILQRIKELAKISTCVSLLQDNKSTFEEHFYVFKKYMDIVLPDTRPYSKCGTYAGPCKCCNWVPAVYHKAQVTEQQKMDYVLERKMATTAAEVVLGTKRLGTMNQRLLLGQNVGGNNSAAKIWEETNGGKSGINMESYNQRENFRVFGGVLFCARSKPVKNVQNLRNYIASDQVGWCGKVGHYDRSQHFLVTKRSTSEYSRLNGSEHQRSFRSNRNNGGRTSEGGGGGGSRRKRRKKFTGGSTINTTNKHRLDYVGDTWVYALKPVGKTILQGKIGITCNGPNSKGLLDRAEVQKRQLEKKHKCKFEVVRYRRVFQSKMEARSFEAKMTNYGRKRNESHFPLEHGKHPKWYYEGWV